MKCSFMNKNTVVLLIEYNTTTNSIDKILDVYHIEYAPLSIVNAEKDRSKNLAKELNLWFKGRGIPSWRKNIEKLLMNLGLKTPDELLNKAYALSLSDQYWIKEESSDILWKDINFFEHDFKYMAFLHVAIHDSSSCRPDLRSPNNTTDGMLQKAWVIEENKRVLVKGTYTASRQEPINEWLASEICKRLEFSHCAYHIDLIDDSIVSKCENFITKNEEILSAYDVFHSMKKDNSVNDYQHYLQVLNMHHVPHAAKNLEQMFLLDYLMMNTDRHMKNFGVIRNVETLNWERLTPIFDTGQSMNCDNLTKNMKFHDGTGKFFTNTNKKFSTYMDYFTEVKGIDISSLNGLDHEYFNILKFYQDYTEMTDIRIEKLVKGLQLRIELLKHGILP